MDWLWVLVLAMWLLPVLMILMPGPLRRRRSAVAAWLERLAGRVRGRRPAEPDPFTALRVQMRLAALSRELQWLEDAPAVYARAHRIAAVRAAYDDLLLEACVLAGVDVPADARRSAAERWRKEASLAEHGWTW